MGLPRPVYLEANTTENALGAASPCLSRAAEALDASALWADLHLVRLSGPPATMQDSGDSAYRSPGSGDVSRQRRGPRFECGKVRLRCHSARLRLAALKFGLWHFKGLYRTRPGTEGPRRRRRACRRKTPTAPRDETAGDIYTHLYSHVTGALGARRHAARLRPRVHPPNHAVAVEDVATQ